MDEFLDSNVKFNEPQIPMFIQINHHAHYSPLTS